MPPPQSPGAQSPGPQLSGPLARGFFARPAPEVAPDLLGCVLRHDAADGAVAVMITEVEAYAGTADAASHAFRGQTARNAVMFGAPGHAYVYFTYGMHFCMNLVCLPEGTASAVLLRAGRVIDGAGLAARRRSTVSRGIAAGGAARARRASGPGRVTGAEEPTGAALPRTAERDLARGPARLCQALGIDRSLDGADVCDPASPLLICGPAGAVTGICRGPRVGVSRAAAVPWRYWIESEPTVSVYRAHSPRRRAVEAVSVPGPEGGTIQR